MMENWHTGDNDSIELWVNMLQKWAVRLLVPLWCLIQT